MRQLSAFHADVSCAQPGALDCNRFGELVLDIFGEEVLVTRAKEIMGVVVIMARSKLEARVLFAVCAFKTDHPPGGPSQMHQTSKHPAVVLCRLLTPAFPGTLILDTLAS